MNQIQPQCLHAVKRSLAQFELINVRRRRPAHLQMHGPHIVDVLAEARMGFQPLAVRQINRVCRDIVDRGCAVSSASGFDGAGPRDGAALGTGGARTDCVVTRIGSREARRMGGVATLASGTLESATLSAASSSGSCQPRW